MKRILLTVAVIVALVIPSRAQGKVEKITRLENLEQKTELVTPPDTLILEEEEMIEAPEAMPVEEEMIESAEAMPAEEAMTGYPEETIEEETEMEVPETTETVIEPDDDTVIRIGKKDIRIISNNDKTEIHIEDDKDSPRPRPRARFFEGHLGGVEIGYNNYTTGQWVENPEPVEGFLDLNTAKSASFNIIVPAVSLGFTRHFGLVTSLGINFNNYRFDGNNSITTGEGGLVLPLYPADGIEYEKSKFTTIYGILPVMLELQLPVKYGSTFNLGVGVIGAVKLGSHTKTVYYDDVKQKEKVNDDFSLNMFRYGVTAMAGYEMIQVYGTCYLSPLFETGKGPELYPFEVGIALTIND